MTPSTPQLNANVNADFSPTSSVRNSSRKWIEEVPPIESCFDDNQSPRTTLLSQPSNSFGEHVKRSASIDYVALDRFATEITNSIIDKNSLEVAEWDGDGWHYTGENYWPGEAAVVDKDNDVFHELMRMERVALYVLSLDAINFCFWPVSLDRTSSPGRNGSKPLKNCLEYEHLAIALRKVSELDDDVETNSHNRNIDSCSDTTIIRSSSTFALCPENLAELTPEKLHDLLQPHFPLSSSQSKDGESAYYELPHSEIRCRLLNELGKGLIERHNGSALHMIAKANKSSDALVGIILDTFPGFRDCVNSEEWKSDNIPESNVSSWWLPSSSSLDWDNAKLSPSVIHFYKRAQIAVADIWGALGRNRGVSLASFPTTSSSDYSNLLTCCQFTDMNLITTFPDYRVPQILRHVGALRYGSSLASLVDNEVELERGGMDEVSIRAGTVVAVEDLVARVKEKLAQFRVNKSEEEQRSAEKLSEDISAVTVDWYLWQSGEKMDRKGLLAPHHRVLTVFY